MYLKRGTMKEISVLIFISGIPAYYLPGERVRSEVVGARDVVEAVGYKKMHII